jgi:hypothetical protein
MIATPAEALRMIRIVGKGRRWTMLTASAVAELIGVPRHRAATALQALVDAGKITAQRSRSQRRDLQFDVRDEEAIVAAVRAWLVEHGATKLAQHEPKAPSTPTRASRIPGRAPQGIKHRVTRAFSSVGAE